jgi:glutamate racemase
MLGIFDSGVGGLTLWREIKKRRPKESLLYFADTAHMPYGEKSPSEILALTKLGVQTLLDHGATHILIGCHTIAVHLSQAFINSFSCPFYDIASATLLLASSYQKIAVIGTKATIASNFYQEHLKDRLIASIACPELAPMIEKGDIHLSVIKRSLAPLPKETRAILYGCTHFPFIDPYIASLTEIKDRLNPALSLAKILPTVETCKEDIFLTSGDPEKFYSLASSLLGTKLSFPLSVKSLYY